MSQILVSIRMRHRRGYVREAGHHMAWTEYQVVRGRAVLHHSDFREQAEIWARKNGYQIEDGKPDGKE